MINDEEYDLIINNKFVQLAIKEWIEDIMSVKDIAKNTNNGEERVFPDHERKLKDFNKEFSYRSTIFRCTICFTPRKYGEHGKPEQTMALILCEGTCKKHTWHSYIGMFGRGDSNYVGISNNT